MANKKIIQTVENKCKTLGKPLVNLVYFFVQNFHSIQKPVYKTFIPPTFPTFPTHFFTTTTPLFKPYFFHYSTKPIITTTNLLIERK